MSEDFYYTPKKDASIDKCVDLTEYNKMLADIKTAKVNESQRDLLILLASRFIVFKYEKLADYYAITTSEMKTWLEKLRCVIVDTDSAIKNGYFTYQESYDALLKEIVNEK